MKVTVCELPDDRLRFTHEWGRLVEHVALYQSDFVLLPEMPFCAWFADTWRSDPGVWAAAVRAHDEWELRFHELAPAAVAWTRPVNFGNERYCEAVVWDVTHGLRSVHAKAPLRDEPGFWEAEWYNAATPEFTPLDLNGIGIGFLLGKELLSLDEAERYGAEGVSLLLTPRTTERDGAWQEAGRRAAIASRAYALSSNRVDAFDKYGGEGWIIDPAGTVLASTNKQQPFATLEFEVRGQSG